MQAASRVALACSGCSHVPMAPFLYLLGERVEVESADDGFEGCWCEAIVTKQLRSKGHVADDPNMCAAQCYCCGSCRFCR